MTRRYERHELVHWRTAQAERVLYLRARFDLTQAGLASLCGVDVRTLRRWEAGTSAPTAAAQTVLRALEVHGYPQSVQRWATEGGLTAIVAAAVSKPRRRDRGKKKQAS